MPKENEEIEGEIMYLTEYLKMRGVNANALTHAEVRALAGSMLNHTLPMDAPAPVKQIINPGHAHEAMDRCHVLLCTLNDHLLQHPYVESDADVRREVETANAALSRAYQLIGGFPHKDAK